MGHGHNASSFWIRCIGYTQRSEKYFTIDQEYEVCDGVVVSDNGFIYKKDPYMKPDSDPETWYLSRWYEFEIVNDDILLPDRLDLSFNELMG
jgi:hypothetical protein